MGKNIPLEIVFRLQVEMFLVPTKMKHFIHSPFKKVFHRPVVED